MTRSALMLSLVLAIAPAAFAQDKTAPAGTKPAAPADAVPEALRAVLGTYKSDNPAAPTIVLKATGSQLILSATGFPDIPVTMDAKGALTNPILPADYAFAIVRDKDGKVTGLEVKTPQGGGVFAKQADAAKPAAPKPAIPDVLGKYEPTEPGPVGTLEIKFVDGKIISEAEGQPSIEIKIGANLEATSPSLPAGVTAQFTKDKDGKVTGLKIEASGTVLNFARKTFVAPPSAAPAAPAAPATLPDVLGRYEPDAAGPVGPIEISADKGKLISEVENQPLVEFTVGKQDEIIASNLPTGVTAKFTRDKDAKVTGIKVEIDGNALTFTRKTFPKPPAVVDPAARLKAATGKYVSDTGGVPVVTLSLKDGKLVLQAEGHPEMEVDVDDKDFLTGKGLPEGFKLNLVRDKDGKVTGMHAATPMGDADFKREAPAEEKKPVAEEDKVSARLKGATGTYKAGNSAVPDVKMFLKDGKLYIQAEGYPEIAVKIDDKDKLSGEGLPEGFELTLIRDKDGKVTGMSASTPMGDVEFTRTPAEEKKPA